MNHVKNLRRIEEHIVFHPDDEADVRAAAIRIETLEREVRYLRKVLKASRQGWLFVRLKGKLDTTYRVSMVTAIDAALRRRAARKPGKRRGKHA